MQHNLAKNIDVLNEVTSWDLESELADDQEKKWQSRALVKAIRNTS